MSHAAICERCGESVGHPHNCRCSVGVHAQETKARLILARLQGHGYWELRVNKASGPGGYVVARLTHYQLSDLLAGAWTTVAAEFPGALPGTTWLGHQLDEADRRGYDRAMERVREVLDKHLESDVEIDYIMRDLRNSTGAP